MTYFLVFGRKVGNMQEFKHFKFWCQKVLPLVYDSSLSYYEVLCKVVDYINKIIDDNNSVVHEIEELKAEIAVIQKWIDDFNADYLEQLIEDTLLKMIIVGLTDDGHIVFYVADSWDDITFNTTGYDIIISDIDFGHLVLSY